MRYAQQDEMLDRARHELATIHAESAADRMNDKYLDADYQTVARMASELERGRDYADAAPLWSRAANLATSEITSFGPAVVVTSATRPNSSGSAKRRDKRNALRGVCRAWWPGTDEQPRRDYESKHVCGNQ